MRILLADDEETLRSVIRQVLEADGHEVVEAASGEIALESFRKNPCPILVTDILMGRMTGLELLSEIRLIDPDCVTIVMTSHASLETATTALRAGAYDYLTKPFDELDMISTVVNRAVEKVKLADDNRRLLDNLKRKTEELEHLNGSLRDMANRDGLTALFNHRYFRESLEREVARYQRNARPFSLVLMDIDHFKRFNDTYGHLAGDEALRKVADVLRSVCRTSSIAARYGGEEFVVLAPDVEKSGAVVLAERIRTEIRDAEFSGSGSTTTRLTASLGVAGFGEDAQDGPALIDAADRALYRAKQAGRDRVMLAGTAPDVEPAFVHSSRAALQAPTRSAAGTAGIRITKAAPRPTSLSTTISPPWSFTMP